MLTKCKDDKRLDQEKGVNTSSLKMFYERSVFRIFQGGGRAPHFDFFFFVRVTLKQIEVQKQP